jgi:ribose 5-phosphate isomerase B
MKVYLGSDHAGVKLKEDIKKFLDENGYEHEDMGTNSEESCDYPDYALAVAEKVVAGAEAGDKGILICGSGIGMSIAANKVRGARAALCHNEWTAVKSREHNDANILCIGAKVVESHAAVKMVKVWLKTEFEGAGSGGERHKRRADKFSDIEGRCCK